MKIFTIIVSLLLSLSPLFGQSNNESNKIKAAKEEFFTERLELTPGESKKFWPVYNDYQNRKSLLSNERKTIMHYFNENESNMTPEEISQSLNRYIEIEKEEAQLLERYNEKFKQVLPNEKVLRIYICEIEFKNYLLKQLRTRQQNITPRN